MDDEVCPKCRVSAKNTDNPFDLCDPCEKDFYEEFMWDAIMKENKRIIDSHIRPESNEAGN